MPNLTIYLPDKHYRYVRTRKDKNASTIIKELLDTLLEETKK